MTRSLWVRAALVYLGLRLFSGLLLAQAADQQPWFPGITGPREGDVDLALSWDAQWYRRIAEDGYPAMLPTDAGEVRQNPWAFYPVFPLTARAVGAATGLGFEQVAPALALLAGLGAALLMARLWTVAVPALAAPGRDSVVLACVAVWAACPVAAVLQQAYSEAFSVLLLVAFLLAVVRERWWAAAAVVLLVGLTRPIALPLCVVVLVAVLLRWRARQGRPIERRESYGLAALVAASGISGLLWTALAWAGTGRRDAYPATMASWRGDGAIEFWQPWRRSVELALEYGRPESVLPVLAMGAALVVSFAMLIPAVAGGIDLRLRVWCAAYAVYLLAVVDGTTSIFRYLLLLFPLAVLLVGAARGVSRWWGWRTLVWVVAGLVGQVGWIWWLVLFEPPSDFPP